MNNPEHDNSTVSMIRPKHVPFTLWVPDVLLGAKNFTPVASPRRRCNHFPGSHKLARAVACDGTPSMSMQCARAMPESLCIYIRINMIEKKKTYDGTPMWRYISKL